MNHGFKYFILSLFLLVFAKSFAQKPCFTIDNKIGCTPLTVTVKNCINTTSPIYYNYGENKSSIVLATTYTYKKAGKYTIKQYFTNTQGITDSLVLTDAVTVVDAKAPIFKYNYCAGNKIKISFPDTVSQFYTYFVITQGTKKDTVKKAASAIISFQDSSSQSINIRGVIEPTLCGTDTNLVLSQLYNSPVFPHIDSLTSKGNTLSLSHKAYQYLTYNFFKKTNTVDSLISTYEGKDGKIKTDYANFNLSNDTEFKLSTYDVCENKNYAQDWIKVRTTKVSATQNKNIIEFSSIENPDAISEKYIVRNDGKQFIINTNESIVEDTTVKCLQTYCYKIITKSAAGSNIIGPENCIKAISTSPPVLKQLSASVIDNKTVFVATSTANARVQYYNWYAVNNGKVDSKFVQSTKNEYDTLLNGVKCMAVQLVDSCKNTSPISTQSCNIFLTGNTIPNGMDLNFSNYVAGDNKQTRNYEILLLNSQNETFLTIDNKSNTSYKDFSIDTVTAITKYKIKLVENGETLFSNLVEKLNPGKIFFPNAFTPNGDGNNDVFLPKGRFISTYQLLIFDRESRLVFKSTDFKHGWNGDNFPAGDYIFEYEAQDLIGNKYANAGIVTLIK